MTRLVALVASVGLTSAVLTTACVTHVLVPAPAKPTIVRWTIPLDAADDMEICVATVLEAGVAPADVRPLRCLSVGAVRAWIRGTRFANE